MSILVLGVGNILLSDEGIGVRVIEALEQRYVLPEGVEVLDGGTAGMELLEAMANRTHLIIVDAVVSRKSDPGALIILRDDEVPVLFNNKISPHQLGLSDVLSALRFTDEFPENITLIGVTPQSLEPHIGLTPVVQASLEPALQAVIRTLGSCGIKVRPREVIHV
jgi:hydrogenase maturation protease